MSVIGAKAYLGRFAEYTYTVLFRPWPMRKFLHVLLSPFVPDVVKVKRLKIACNDRDSVLSIALRLGIYEPYEQQLFEQHCQPGQTVIDLGANVGLYTAIAASRVGAAGRVIAVDPDPGSFSALQRTIALNGFTNVTPVNVAAGDRDCEARLYIDEFNGADGRLYDAKGRRDSVSVVVRRMDSILREANFTEIDVIKMDIQGCEALAWSGMRDLLADSRRTLTLFLEFWPWGLSKMGSDPHSFIENLIEFGFEFERIDERSRSVRPISDPQAFAINYSAKQYNSASLQRSHQNLILTKRP